jgi:hypothetical protein
VWQPRSIADCVRRFPEKRLDSRRNHCLWDGRSEVVGRSSAHRHEVTRSRATQLVSLAPTKRSTARIRTPVPVELEGGTRPARHQPSPVPAKQRLAREDRGTARCRPWALRKTMRRPPPRARRSQLSAFRSSLVTRFHRTVRGARRGAHGSRRQLDDHLAGVRSRQQPIHRGDHVLEALNQVHLVPEPTWSNRQGGAARGPGCPALGAGGRSPGARP